MKKQKNFAAIAAKKLNTIADISEGNGPLIWTVENLIKAAAAAGAKLADSSLTDAAAEAMGSIVLKDIENISK